MIIADGLSGSRGWTPDAEGSCAEGHEGTRERYA